MRTAHGGKMVSKFSNTKMYPETKKRFKTLASMDDKKFCEYMEDLSRTEFNKLKKIDIGYKVDKKKTWFPKL